MNLLPGVARSMYCNRSLRHHL